MSNSESNAPEQTTLNIEDLESYVLIGTHRETKEVVAVSSAKMPLPLMGQYIGRLQADLQISAVQAGLHFYTQQTAAQKAQKSNIVKP